MEETVVNRLTALLLVLTIADGNAFGQGQASNRAGSPPVRLAQNTVVYWRAVELLQFQRMPGSMDGQFLI